MIKTMLIALSIFIATIILNVSIKIYSIPIYKAYHIIETLNNHEEYKVINIVNIFGKKLKNVPLLASKDILVKSIKDNYRNYVTKRLLVEWIKDPTKAPGRLTSSPWPDRIEIKTVAKIDKNTYKVEGEIIEITSAEIVSKGVAARRSITLIVRKINDCWIIDEVTLGNYKKSDILTTTKMWGNVAFLYVICDMAASKNYPSTFLVLPVLYPISSPKVSSGISLNLSFT